VTLLLIALWSVPTLLTVPLLAVALRGWSAATRAVYGACLAVCLVVFTVSLIHLLGAGNSAPSLHLPVGLPWTGAHFRLDALTAFFLAVANLGMAGASLFALGYGLHEQSPACCPSTPLSWQP
jgi:hydrogenase-4 component B